MPAASAFEERILILAPRGRDAQVIAQVLAGSGLSCSPCSDYMALIGELGEGAGAAVIAEEALVGAKLDILADWLAQQASWSDFPFVLLVSRHAAPRADAVRTLLGNISNVILLERPLNAETIRRATASALRARKRQYQTRSDQEALRELNETLEQRIDARTAELAQANDRLMREITERERAQVALVQAQKMEAVGQLTGGIAHDFNNLLNVISGNVELIERYSSDERVQRMAQTARRSAQRGAKLTGQLLAFSRSQSLNLQPVCLTHLMDEVRDLISAAMGPDIRLEFGAVPALPPVMADISQTELAILNLAINARDAMPDGGVLAIACAHRPAPAGLLPPGEYAVIEVRDTGQGINPEILSKVFDPFFTTKALGKGTGLGLSQVYGIAQQSGGAARIDSRVGGGTTVELWLPLAPPALAGQAAARAAEPLRAPGAARILVVEDDPDVRQFIVECLEMSGHRVTQAEHGEAGLAQIDRVEPDLMIVDFLMPGMNGAQLAAEVGVKRPGLPIIIATGYADMQEIERVVGKNAVLKKPFQMRELLESVRVALMR
ncbi:MAG: response regulator [Noviherbaspirillum sp.]